jgi:hypothetical protein
MKSLLLGLVAFVGYTASPLALAAQPTPDGLGALVRQLVVDSLRGGGARAEEVLVAADSASAALLRLADVPAAGAPLAPALVCPGSTEADGRPAPPPVGYLVQAALAVGTDTTVRQLRVTKSCRFRYRGRARNFAEGSAWELRREGGRWRVTATFDRWIT